MASTSAKTRAKNKGGKPPIIKFNKTTMYIVVGGAVLSALAWFLFASPSAKSLAQATEQREVAELTQRRLDQEVTALADGSSFAAGELPALVGPVEAMLPNAGSPTDAVDRIQAAATANGIVIDSSAFPSAYSAPDAGRTQAAFTVEASGPLSALAAWLTEVRLDQQLVTAEVTAVTTDDETGRATMSITFTVWGTDLETWADGLDQVAATPGLTPEEIAEADAQLVAPDVGE